MADTSCYYFIDFIRWKNSKEIYAVVMHEKKRFKGTPDLVKWYDGNKEVWANMSAYVR